MYRGKYPNRIKAIWINRRPEHSQGMFVKTNLNNIYLVVGIDRIKLGEEITDFPKGTFELIEALS